ncbi:MAG: SixA phosphatase family protein [Acidimicrobiales bacterium]
MLESVVVVRHAKAGDRLSWSGDDLARPLDEDGLGDALSLPARLASVPIEEIWTSPAVRCQHTVAALAANRRVPVLVAEWLLAAADINIGSDPIAAARAGLDAIAATSIVLCSHREAIPDLLAALGPLPLADVPVLDKCDALVLRFDGGVVAEAELIQPRHAIAVS